VGQQKKGTAGYSPESARSFLEQVTALQRQRRSRQAAELFGGGANAFSEYERGTTRPARSTVMLLHLLDHHPELLQELRRLQH